MDCRPGNATASTGNELVAERDRASGQDVRAQAATVNERPEEARPRDPLEVGARLAQAAPDALDFADPKTTPDERVQRHAAGDDVPPRALPRDAELVQRLRLDERQLVPAPRPAERSAAGRVAVSLQSPARDRDDRLDADEGRLGLGCDEQPGDRAGTGLAVLFADSASEVEGRDQPAPLDRPAVGHRAGRVEERTRRGAEHDHSVIAVARPNPREPAPGPVEPGRLRDRDEPEIALGEPLSEEEQRLSVRSGRLLAQDLGEARAELRLEYRHAPILGARDSTSWLSLPIGLAWTPAARGSESEARRARPRSARASERSRSSTASSSALRSHSSPPRSDPCSSTPSRPSSSS